MNKSFEVLAPKLLTLWTSQVCVATCVHPPPKIPGTTKVMSTPLSKSLESFGLGKTFCDAT